MQYKVGPSTSSACKAREVKKLKGAAWCRIGQSVPVTKACLLCTSDTNTLNQLALGSVGLDYCLSGPEKNESCPTHGPLDLVRLLPNVIFLCVIYRSSTNKREYELPSTATQSCGQELLDTTTENSFSSPPSYLNAVRTRSQLHRAEVVSSNPRMNRLRRIWETKGRLKEGSALTGGSAKKGGMHCYVGQTPWGVLRTGAARRKGVRWAWSGCCQVGGGHAVCQRVDRRLGGV